VTTQIEALSIADSQDTPMLLAILISLFFIAALGYSMQSERNRGLISEHSYNNRHSDAAGAREDHLG
jgi:hypothetical protein